MIPMWSFAGPARGELWRGELMARGASLARLVGMAMARDEEEGDEEI
jgi:hypothetical protein